MGDKQNDNRNAIGDIIAVAHELRTPLTAIQGAVEILRDESAGALSPTQREFVSLAHRNLARLTDRIEDAIDIASRKSGFAAQPIAVLLEELADSVAKRAALESGPELRIRFDGFSGKRRPAMEDRSLCRTLASIIGTVRRHLGQDDVLVRALVEHNRIGFEIGADSAPQPGREYAVIHDASLALACEMVEIHGGSIAGLATGCCGVYVLLPLLPIDPQEETR